MNPKPRALIAVLCLLLAPSALAGNAEEVVWRILIEESKRDGDVGEDIAHDTWVRLKESDSPTARAALKSPGDFRSYIKRCYANQRASHFRKMTTYRDYLVESHVIRSLKPDAVDTDIDIRLIRAQLAADSEHGPWDDNLCLDVFDLLLQGASREKAAKQLGVTESTVRKAMARIRAALRSNGYGTTQITLESPLARQAALIFAEHQKQLQAASEERAKKYQRELQYLLGPDGGHNERMRLLMEIKSDPVLIAEHRASLVHQVPSAAEVGRASQARVTERRQSTKRNRAPVRRR